MEVMKYHQNESRYSVRKIICLLTDLPSTFLELFFHGGKKKDNLILTQKGASLQFFFHTFRHLSSKAAILMCVLWDVSSQFPSDRFSQKLLYTLLL